LLSYRHAFHAANAADVFKHLVLSVCIDYMCKKETAFLYADTHAGAGSYNLNSGYAAENREWTNGLERLRLFSRQSAINCPLSIQRYLGLVDDFEKQKGKNKYPGSPAIAAALLRRHDSAVLFELHPSDEPLLKKYFAGNDHVQVFRKDGLISLEKMLPPPSRRALILVDPSYEVKDEYEKVVDSMRIYLRRFASGVYMVWYPLLERYESKAFPSQLSSLQSEKTCRIELRLQNPGTDGLGMNGSGLIIFNPPWILKNEFEESLPYLKKALTDDPDAECTLDWKE
jgi:23S rRNA (adenine2030-N6)-methyltransferase